MRHDDPESAVRALRWCEHGERVSAGLGKGCSGCVNGICAAALACMRAEPEPAPPARRSLIQRFAAAVRRLFN